MPVCQHRGQLLPGSPALPAFQGLHLLRPIRVTSQNSNLPAACHFKTGSVEDIAGVLVYLVVTQLLLQKPDDVASVANICWHEKEAKQIFWITLYVIHIVIALHINSHNLKIGKGILFWQPYCCSKYFQRLVT